MDMAHICVDVQVVLVNHDEDPNLLALDDAAVDAIANSIARHSSDGQRAGIQVQQRQLKCLNHCS